MEGGIGSVYRPDSPEVQYPYPIYRCPYITCYIYIVYPYTIGPIGTPIPSIGADPSHISLSLSYSYPIYRCRICTADPNSILSSQKSAIRHCPARTQTDIFCRDPEMERLKVAHLKQNQVSLSPIAWCFHSFQIIANL